MSIPALVVDPRTAGHVRGSGATGHPFRQGLVDDAGIVDQPATSLQVVKRLEAPAIRDAFQLVLAGLLEGTA